MIKTVFEEVAQISEKNSSRAVGYCDDELAAIERLYDIRLTGDLRQFMSEAGRSDGGLIGDDPIILYRSTWSVRTQIVFQLKFFDLMQEDGNFEYLGEKPFVFSCESETLYFFLKTAAADPDRVYQYDENSGTVVDTKLSFIDYMKRTVQVWGGKDKVVCRGELLIV